MNEFTEEKKNLTEEAMEEVSGGRQQPVGPGTEIQWDDPRCLHAGDWARTFSGRFQTCKLYSEREKKLVKQLCDDFIRYISTEEYFDLYQANVTFVRISSALTAASMEPAPLGAWRALTNVFYTIVT